MVETVLLNEFKGYEQERDLIGKMLIAYGELEFALLGCVRKASKRDMHTCVRILFRAKGESARLGIADAILRPVFAARGNLEDKWITAYAAIRHCKNIRNQYAHCHWRIHKGKLCFIDLDEEAKSHYGPMHVVYRPVDLALLERQFLYFGYAIDYLYFFYEKLAGTASPKRPKGPPYPEPKSIPRPPRDNRQAKAAPPPEEETD
jgi:hypothetical protein